MTQCEIVQTTMLGAAPTDEDLPPQDPDDMQPHLFDFFGYGQPGPGPLQAPPQDDALAAEEWGLWPEQPPNQQHPAHHNGDNMAIDQVVAGEPFLELNDLIQPQDVNNVAMADFDLNEPLPDDLGGVDDILPDDILQNLVPPQPQVPEHVIDASSESSESEGDAPIFNLNEPVHVEVFLPQVQMMPDEIPEEDLMSSDDSAGDQLELEQPEQENLDHNQIQQLEPIQNLEIHQEILPDQQQNVQDQLAIPGQDLNQSMQLGFVQIAQPTADPVFSHLLERPTLSAASLHPDLFRLWSAHFSGNSSPNLQVPPEWAAFFTASLMNPGSFDWAKKFLSSPAWAYFANPGPNDFAFHIPLKCPVTKSPSCLITSANTSLSIAEDLVNAVPLDKEEQDLATPSNNVTTAHSPPSESIPDGHVNNISPSTGPWSRALLAKAGKIHISEDDPGLRRSCRQKQYKRGYKDMACKDKLCLACDASPPTISPSIIKNLGASFCNVDAEKLSKVTQVKSKKAGPVGKKPTVKKIPTNGDNNDKDNKKRPKKPKK